MDATNPVQDAFQRYADLTNVRLPDDVVTSLRPVTEAFQAAGHDLYLVGGSVRDAALGRACKDLDLTTGAQPKTVQRIVAPLADATWDTGLEYGTVAFRRGGDQIEITTFRADSYDPDSRKPTISFGDNINDDLSRRDFTINAMAVNLATQQVEDPFQGVQDLRAKVLRTPLDPTVCFSEDPLRMMRAARFASQLGFRVDLQAVATMFRLRDRIHIVSVERVQAELAKLFAGGNPCRGMVVLRDAGLDHEVLPELLHGTVRLLPAASRTIPQHHDHRSVLMTAAAFHDANTTPEQVAHRLRTLRYPAATVQQVSHLVDLHTRFTSQTQWTAAAVRTFCHHAGTQLDHAELLASNDPALQGSVAGFRRQRQQLSRREDLTQLGPELDGRQIMATLDVKPGRHIGDATRFLQEHRLMHGPVGEPAAQAALKQWWQSRDAQAVRGTRG